MLTAKIIETTVIITYFSRHASGHFQIAAGTTEAAVHPVESIGGLAATDMCPCPNNVTYCQQLPTVTKLEGGLQRLHSADDVVTECLTHQGL